MLRARRTTAEEKILNTVDKTDHFFLEFLRDERREVLWQASLDTKGKLLACRQISSGGVVLAHNHPSGLLL